jgi:tetratricopeptide (TPR) repeat protein
MPPASPSPAPTPRVSLSSRAFAALGELRKRLGARGTTVLVVAGFVAATMLAGGFFMWMLTPPAPVEEGDPSLMVLDALDEGNASEVRRQAVLIPLEESDNDEVQARISFALGVTLEREAKSSQSDTQRGNFDILASEFLSESHIRGGVPGREYELLSHWARSLFRNGRFGEALAIASQALTHDENAPAADEVSPLSEIARAEVEHIAAESALRVEPPKLDIATVHVDRILADPEISPAERSAATLLRVEAYLLKQDFDEAQKILDGIEISTPKLALLSYRVLEGRVTVDPESVSQEMWQQLLQRMRKVGAEDVVSRTAAELRYAMAMCQRYMGDHDAALLELSRTRQLFANTPAGISAALAEGEMLAAQGNDDASSKAILRTISEFIASGATLGPSRIEDVRRRIEDLQSSYTAHGNFDAALSLCQMPPGLIDATQLIRWRASIHKASALHAEKQAQSLKRAEAKKIQAVARRQWRFAAQATRELAWNSFGDKRFLLELQDAAESFLKGHDFVRTLEVIAEHGKYDSSQGSIAMALARSEAELSLGRSQTALETLKTFIERFPADPTIYRARVLAAKAARESGDLAAARDLLMVNLTHDALSPRSTEWRDSQFLLGELWYDEARQLEAKVKRTQFDSANFDGSTALTTAWSEAYVGFDKAADALEAALNRYPDAPQSEAAFFLLGESHRRAAERSRRRLNVENLETGRAARVREIRARLEAAIVAYDRFNTLVHARNDADSISPIAQLMIRNSFFAKAGCLYDLEKWDEAIKVYSTTTSRWQQEPEALEAYVQLAACHRRLGRNEEARSAIEQAKVALERIAPERNFQATTRFSRDEWQDTLEWLSKG